MPMRRIPSTGELLPVIGLGSSKPVGEIATKGTAAIKGVVQALLDQGGRVIDTWPRNASNDAKFAGALNELASSEKLFLTTKVSTAGHAGIEQLEQSLRSYGRTKIDLAQVFSLTDIKTHWPVLQEWKASGRARYIGVTVSEYALYEQLESFLTRNTPDFVQFNYSITERRAEERLLPLARDKGLAVLINRPFMNGEYFTRLANKPLPAWAAEHGIHDWAGFSLKYLLAAPAITCVLTETSNPRHMTANAKAASGAALDEPTRKRMAAFIDAV
jgi:diketogulonate reductase-like aldo/keto reductase